jgi:hypothetical protein
VTVKESKAERIRTLKEWVLKLEELGKKVDSPGGTQVWSHIKWANGLSSRVCDVEDKSAFLLSKVFDVLPEPVRDLVRKEPRTTYDKLATAVHSLDTKDLKDAAARYSRDKETARLARLQNPYQSPMGCTLRDPHTDIAAIPEPSTCQPQSTNSNKSIRK